MGDITEYETEQIGKANGSGRTPVVFVHGLWLLPSSWDRWRTVFEERGLHDAVARVGPTTPTRSKRRTAHPEVFAHKTVGQIADHFEDVIGKLTKQPAVIGHSFGGLLTQILAGRGLSDASVAIDPAPFRGVLAAADLGAEVGVAGARQPGEPRSGRAAHLRAVPLRVRERGQRGRGQGAVQHVRGARFGRAALPGRDREPQPVDRSRR